MAIGDTVGIPSEGIEMIIKTSELEGVALDWAVNKAQGSAVDVRDVWVFVEGETQPVKGKYSPSTEWRHGGILIEKYRVALEKAGDGYAALVDDQLEDGSYNHASFGSSHLIAAMRAIVTAELGETVDVPEELAG